MASYSHPAVSSKSHLKPPPAPSRKPSQRLLRPPNELDDFLSSDLELSFASTMSLNSPPASPPKELFTTSNLHAYSPESSPMPMDISPAPVSKTSSSIAVANNERRGRPRAFTTARTFGRELSNRESPSLSTTNSVSVKNSENKLQRSALPSEWMCAFPQAKEDPPSPVFSSTDASDAMDIDDCVLPASLTQPESMDEPTVTLGLAAAPTVTSFSNLFFDAVSPESSPAPARPLKRRSLSPEGSPRQDAVYRQRHSNEGEVLQPAFEESSSPGLPSPSAHKFERFASTGGGLFGKSIKPLPILGVQSSSSSSSSGNKRLRRPALSAGNVHAQSAYPIMDSMSNKENSMAGLPPARRAFSATIAPIPGSPSSDDNSEAGPDFSSPAAQAFAKRQTLRSVRRRDGTDDFRPLTGAGMLRQRDVNPPAHSPLRKAAVIAPTESPSSRWFNGAGLPGFGDNEAHGKILPCERVPEDGLMRIDAQTLDALLAGKYDDKIASYQVIDCRFEYEYQGGHIKGAVNVNTTAEIEEFLLGDGARKPLPSCSGDIRKKSILIFHCEFSAKRAPTFAKHLRSKDRAMNNHNYPRIHYPEVYILKGGYSQYYQESAIFSEPRGYVRMDDPQFASDRRQDLDQFRTKTRFGRTRSYAYGEASKASSSSQQSHHRSSSSQQSHHRSSSGQQNHHAHQQRSTASNGSGPVTSLFAAAGATRTRRSGTIGESAAPRLSTLNEDSLASIMSSDDSCVMDGVDISPCPPPTSKSNSHKVMGMSMFGVRRDNASSGRGPIQRAQTFTLIR
ncbi:hypothetical protein DFH11DRAFT_1030376 [Phellopilus nigrolimitatus]|nr:hypothetical protein DFH11DRAFT_1030376 [Phellopilus nigrolimitatus]